MTEEAKLARQQYMREYRQKNKERITAQRKKYAATHKDQIRESNARYWEKYAARKKAEAAQAVQDQSDTGPATDGTV